MKSNSLTVPTSRSRELGTITITIRNPFTWENVAAFYRRALPPFLEFNRATVQDAKFLTGSFAFAIFFGCMAFFVFPLLLTIFR